MSTRQNQSSRTAGSRCTASRVSVTAVLWLCCLCLSSVTIPTTTALAFRPTSSSSRTTSPSDDESIPAATATAPERTQPSRREYFGQSVASITTAATLIAQPNAASAADDIIAAPARADTFATVQSLRKFFPGAMSNQVLLDRVGQRLIRQNFAKDTTLVASSLCSDEVNRPLEDVFLQYYGNTFAMGGLAGFPFSGVTGFGAMASHIPDGGDCLLVYGPHVGVDSSGVVGKVDRRGKSKSGTCCGSAVAASRYLASVVKGETDLVTAAPSAALDAQQAYVSSLLLPYASEVTSAKEPMVTLPFCTFRPIDNMMQRILGQASSKVGASGKIALLGGVQINTPDGLSDYFLPLRFDVRDSDNKVVADILETITY